ncbi:MAG: hypothetical protein DRQ48_09390 [Gammaproteobacteria bacterium]|nr:MAG: hypothetical protein DRQ48_09390 [Gammaproteobacteria bacterium]
MTTQNDTIFKLSYCLLLTLFLVGCSEKPVGSDYFPLNKGWSWKYRVTTEYSNEDESNLDWITIENLGKEEFSGKSYFVRRTDTGIDYYHNYDEQGIYREGLRTLVESEPRLDRDRRYILKSPLEIGTEWREISRPLLLLRVYPFRVRAGKTAQVPITYRIASMTETVTVPAGTFENCIKVMAEGSFTTYTDAISGETEIPLSIEEWYAPGVGLVKQVRYELDGDIIDIFNTPIFLGGRATLELESFDN